MGQRREGREVALQTLYSLDINPVETREALRLSRESSRVPAAVRDFAEELVTGVMANRVQLDKMIEEKSKNWTLSRMGKIDLNILRIAAFELLYRQDIPKIVTINEAIEIAKKFGTADSPAFINGIVDEIGSSLPDKP